MPKIKHMARDTDSSLSSSSDGEGFDRKFGTGPVHLLERPLPSTSQASLFSSSPNGSYKRRARLARSPQDLRKEAAPERRQLKQKAQSISDDDGSDGNGSSSSSNSSSSSEGDNLADEDFTASPKKKTRMTKIAKAAGAGSSSLSTKKPFKMPTLVSKEKETLQADFSDILRQSQEQNRARLAEMDRELFMAAASQTSGSSTSDVPVEAKKLKNCPFCHEGMPRRMSPALVDVMQYWLDQYHQKRRIGATATVEACQKHRNEAQIIPQGRSKGWKHRLNEDRLKVRITNEKLPFINIMKQRVEDPHTSEFFNKLVAERKRYGRQADSTNAQMQNMNEMQAGYYGERGWEVLRNTLVEHFIDFPSSPVHDLNETCARLDGPHQRLSPFNFVERILIPELILMLIISDHTAKGGMIGMDEAKRIRDESAEYGIAMFPSNAMGTVGRGSNAFGDEESTFPLRSKKSSSSVRKHSPKGNGSRILQKDIGKQVLFSGVPKSPRKSEGKRPSSNRGRAVIPTAPTLTPPSQSQQRIAPRPKPRSAAKDTLSQDDFASAITNKPSSGSLTQSSQEMIGQDLNHAIELSPMKVSAIEVVHVPDSSFDDTPKASQDPFGHQHFKSISPSLDSSYSRQNDSTQSEDSRKRVSQRDRAQQWRSSGKWSDD